MNNKGYTQQLLTFVLTIAMSIMGLVSPTMTFADEDEGQGIAMVEDPTNDVAENQEEGQEENPSVEQEEEDEKTDEEGEPEAKQEGNPEQGNAPPSGEDGEKDEEAEEGEGQSLLDTVIGAVAKLFGFTLQAESTTSIPVSITWDDNNNARGKRPGTVRYVLYAFQNGSLTKKDEKTVQSGSSVTFTDSSSNTLLYYVVPVIRSNDGFQYYYAAEGNTVDTRITDDGLGWVFMVGSDSALNFTVKFNPYSIRDITLVKAWNDEGHTEERPSSASFKVYRYNATGESNQEVAETVLLTAADKVSGSGFSVDNVEVWKKTFSYPLIRSNGTNVRYWTEEVEPGGNYQLTQIVDDPDPFAVESTTIYQNSYVASQSGGSDSATVNAVVGTMNSDYPDHEPTGDMIFTLTNKDTGEVVATRTVAYESDEVIKDIEVYGYQGGFRIDNLFTNMDDSLLSSESALHWNVSMSFSDPYWTGSNSASFVRSDGAVDAYMSVGSSALPHITIARSDVGEGVGPVSIQVRDYANNTSANPDDYTLTIEGGENGPITISPTVNSTNEYAYDFTLANGQTATVPILWHSQGYIYVASNEVNQTGSSNLLKSEGTWQYATMDAKRGADLHLDLSAPAPTEPPAPVESETVEIPVQKVWNDNDDEFHNRPTSVTYKLYSVPTSSISGLSYGFPSCAIEPTLVATQNAISTDDYATTFEDQPAYDDSGNALTYIVGEEQVPGYVEECGYNSATGESPWLITQSCIFDGINPITITNRPLTGYSLRVYKVWDDQGHEAERPSTTFGLYELGGTDPLAVVALTSADAVENSTTAENYASVRELHPSLPEDITAVWSRTFPLALTLGSATSEKPYVPQYKNGQPASYEVRETALSGYSSSVGPWEVATTSVKAFNQIVVVTNTRVEDTVDIPVKKVWEDNGDEFGLRPDSVTFCVFNEDVSALASGRGRAAITSTMLENSALFRDSFVGQYEFSGEGDEWEYTIADLPRTDDEGNEIEYCVLEMYPGAGDGTYTPIASENIVWDGENPVVITNAPITIDTSIAKIWDDNDDECGLRPDSITVHLLKDGETLATKVLYKEDAVIRGIGEGVIPNEDGTDFVENDKGDVWYWTNAFDEFPTYDKDGNRIEYVFEEEPTPGYALTSTQRTIKPVVYWLTNTCEVEEPVIEDVPLYKHITIHKEWYDDNNADGARPDSVKIHLLANGKEINSVSLSKDIGWTCEFDGLAFEDENGKRIEYTVTEDEVKGYAAVIRDSETEDGLEQTIYVRNARVHEITWKKIELVPTGDAAVLAVCGTFAVSACGAYVAWRKRR